MEANKLDTYTQKNSLVSFIDNSFWYIYLIIIIAISFANQALNSFFWLVIYAVIFFHAGCYSLFYLFAKKTFNVFVNARLVLLFLGLMLVWLVLQNILPISTYLDQRIFTANSPVWFSSNSVWSVVPERTDWAVLTHLIVSILFCLTLLMLNTRRRLKELVFVFLVVGFVHSLLAILAKYSGVFLIDKAELDGHYEAARGLFVNRNHLASFIVLCLVGPISWLLKWGLQSGADITSNALKNKAFQFSLLFFLLSFTVVILSQSRGGLLALILSLFVYIGLFSRSLKFTIRRRHFFLLFLVFSISTALIFGNGMIDRFSNDALSLGERWIQWVITWQAIKHQWITGYGAGSYELVFQSFRGFSDLRLVIYDQAHNDFLHIFLEQGIVGLMMWLGFIFISIHSAIKACLKAKSTLVKSVLLAGIIVVSAVLIQSVVGYPLQIMTIRCYFFIIIAMMFVAPRVKHV